MSDCVLDTETNIKNTGEDSVGDQKSAPWHPLNHVVYTGWKFPGEEVQAGLREFPDFSRVTRLIGQNLKFDLHYLRKDCEGFEEFLARGEVWDTMLAEYILTGQRAKMISLDALSQKYGGVLKDDRIKEYWNSGIDTEDIPEDEIIPYLENDVLNTEKVYKAQARKAKELGMYTLIRMENEALLATADMEYNGMYFDQEYALSMIHKLGTELQALEQELVEIYQRYITKTEVNINSTQQLSLVLFGGTYRYNSRENVLNEDGTPYRFKSGKKKGQVKTKLVQRFESTKGMGIKPREDWKNKNGWYDTNDSVLKALKRTHQVPFIDKLLKYRDYSKQLNTYYKGCYDLVWPDGCIHHTLNHCITVTSRLSSTKPNSQNFTKND